MPTTITLLNINWLILFLSLVILFMNPLLKSIRRYGGKINEEALSLSRIIINKTFSWALLILLTLFIQQFITYFVNHTAREGVGFQKVLVYTIELAQALLGLILIYQLYKASCIWLNELAEKKGNHFKLILPYLKNGLKLTLILLFFLLLIPNFFSVIFTEKVLQQIAAVLLIVWISSLLILTVSISEKLVLQHYHDQLNINYKARQNYTKIKLIYKIAIGIISFLGVAGALMVFENIREYGASMLASAGVVAVVLGFAAQKTLGNMFIGLQMALTQPIKINDALIVENETGIVEEITLTHVVIKLWDLRRLIIPINYFFEKPFQNLTVKTASLLCTATLEVDFTLPIDAVRTYYFDMLQKSPLWDKQTAQFQVTNLTAEGIQLRALASASDSTNSWNLGCEIREKLITYIKENYPNCLPIKRSLYLT